MMAAMVCSSRIFPLALLIALGACTGPSADAADLGARVDLLASAGYPAGPYGHTVGATLPLLSWIGYAVPGGDALATTAPYAAYSMDDLRQSGRAYGVVHVSSFS